MRLLSVMFTFALCTSALHTTPQFFGVFRPDMITNVEVAKIMPEDKLPDILTGITEIRVKAYRGSTFEFGFNCVDQGKNLTFTSNRIWVGCCAADQELKGTDTTSFDCCNEGEDVTGCSIDRGYKCCAWGYTYDGSTCVASNEDPCARCPIDQIMVNGHCVSPCPEGHVLNNGKCVSDSCPDGLILLPDGKCGYGCPFDEIIDDQIKQCVCRNAEMKRNPENNYLCEVPPPETPCPSGLKTGKCYTLTFENGHRFGYDPKAGFYTASEEHQFGKFKICTNPDCSPGVDIEPGMSFNIQEIQGRAPVDVGQRRRVWLGDARDGAYMTRTESFWSSASFVITKWPGRKHCLGGYDTGVGPAHADGGFGATVLTADDQSCLPVTLMEVPCDIRAAGCNCLAGDKTEAPTSFPADGNANASMPIY